MPHHRNHRAIASYPDQFDTVPQGGFRHNARRHDGGFGSAIPIVPKTETMADLMEHDVALKVGRKRGKIVRVNTNQARAIREGRRPGHSLCIDVLRGLVNLRVDHRRGEPDTPQDKRSGYECGHVTDRRSLPEVLRQQIGINLITLGDRRPHEMVRSVMGIT